MAVDYNICVLNRENDRDDSFVLIKPSSPDIDDVKKAVFDRFPMLQNRPLHMFYNGKLNKLSSLFFKL